MESPEPASSSGQGEALIEAAAEGRLQDVLRILELDEASVSHQNDEGISALMRAAEEGHTEVVEALLEAGCPWNLLDNDNYCAGEYAARHKPIVELLMNFGVKAELMLAARDREAAAATGPASKPANDLYLQQKLHYDGDKLLDADGEAVMMEWEGPLMEEHARVICAGRGHVLNVGFGLGLVDEAIQSCSPASHTIVEAHPDVYAHMMARGWGSRPGVTVLFGRWQDVLPTLISRGFDGIFFDTYGEYYEELRTFHLALPAMLRPGGVYSFFNGLAPDNIFFHLVYGRLVQVELQELGLTTTYAPVAVKKLDAEWVGVKNKYWRFPLYFLPTCQMASPQSVGVAAVEAGTEAAPQ